MRFAYRTSTRPSRCQCCSSLISRLIVVLAALLIVVFPLLFLALLVALLGLEFFFPELVRALFVQVREDEVEDFFVPFDGVAGDAFFDVLQNRLV